MELCKPWEVASPMKLPQVQGLLQPPGSGTFCRHSALLCTKARGLDCLRLLGKWWLWLEHVHYAEIFRWCSDAELGWLQPGLVSCSTVVGWPRALIQDQSGVEKLSVLYSFQLHCALYTVQGTLPCNLTLQCTVQCTALYCALFSPMYSAANHLECPRDQNWEATMRFDLVGRYCLKRSC